MKSLNLIGLFSLMGLLTLGFCSEAAGLTVGDINDTYIWIDPNGDVRHTDKIKREGDIYTFIADIDSNGIMVMKSDITIDGDGHTLGGPNDGNGILFERGGVLLRRCEQRDDQVCEYRGFQ